MTQVAPFTFNIGDYAQDCQSNLCITFFQIKR